MVETNKYMVCVRCMTYNQSSYIEETMNGFTMQQTDFPFVCIVMDDASTDGEPQVIKNYLQDNFELSENSVVSHEETVDYVMTFARHKENRNCFFAVFFLKYNHWQAGKDKAPYYQKLLDNSEYVAICEGDDYWIDARKLQKQVEYMEANPRCTMICNRSKLYSEQQNKYIGETYCYKKDQIAVPKDVIQRGGLFISTCSILHRRSIIENYPEYCKRCFVGDYPLQIMAAMKGYIYYKNEPMSIYRVENSSSWMGKQEWCSPSPKRIKTVQSIISMFEGFSKDYPDFSLYFKQEIAQYINSSIPNWRFSMKDVDFFLSHFQPQIENYSFWWKVDMMIMKVRIPYVRGIYSLIFKKRFEALNTKR